MLGPLIVATFVACSSVSTATDSAVAGPMVQDVTLRSEKHAFELRYPGVYDVIARHPLDPLYEETFYFQNQSSTLMYLQVTELRKYLPKTSTKTESQYLRSLRRLEGFKSIRVDGKSGYEYRVCGRGSCELLVMFIHRTRKYEFAMNIGDIAPARAGFGTLRADQQQVIRSLRFLDE
jgi:hypothetical protein